MWVVIWLAVRAVDALITEAPILEAEIQLEALMILEVKALVTLILGEVWVVIWLAVRAVDALMNWAPMLEAEIQLEALMIEAVIEVVNTPLVINLLEEDIILAVKLVVVKLVLTNKLELVKLLAISTGPAI